MIDVYGFEFANVIMIDDTLRQNSLSDQKKLAKIFIISGFYNTQVEPCSEIGEK